MAGFETGNGPLGTTKLVVPEPLYKGVDEGAGATLEEYEACEAYHEGHGEEGDHAQDEVAATSDEHSGDEETTAAVAATTEEGDGGNGEHGDVDSASTAEGEEHAVDANTPRKEIITPFIRAAATDLNLTFALAVIAVIVIQYFGVSELGWGYPAKFINTPALEKGDVMGFAVGWLELISEISKIISFAFRLFGNIFAGQILLFVIPFLVATLLPVTIYGLEFAVHVIQAAVFAMLFMVFASIAMTSHDHDEEHEHH
jgi:F-type H+-transporting ATPase subunit a